MKLLEQRIPSSDGIHQLYCRIFLPETPPIGLFHVVHGMTEHIRRYEGLMRFLAEQGFCCYGFDNLGHGLTAADESELGYCGKWQYMVEDAQNVSRQMKQAYGENLPCILMGHSMGSFIARCAASPHIWSKAIFMGTGGPNPASDAGLALIRFKIKKEGERAISPTVEKLLFSAYNKRFRDENDSTAWLSTDRAQRDAYRADPLCTFHFTLNGFYTLVKLQALCNRKQWFRSVSDALPILLVSGSDDPVGNYGKGVTAVYNALKKNGKNAEMKLYPGFRHEILNDASGDEVRKDILAFAMRNA